MKGDFTRMPFRRERHYSGVLQQQGRVQLDADWNEQLEIEHHVARTTTEDVIGQSGAPQNGGGFELAAVSCLNAVDVGGGAIWIVGEAGTALSASTGGAPSFTLEQSSTEVELHGVAVVGGGAVAVGDDGTVVTLESGSAGVVKTEVAGVTEPLLAVSFSDPTHAIAVGKAAKIVATGNGSDWVLQTQPAGVTEDLHAVWCVDNQHAWAVGDAGRIITLTQGGTTWTAQTSGLTADLRGVWFSDQDNGVVVGAGGTVATTSDGGQTWNSIELEGVTDTLCAVHGTAGSLWAVGELATALYSSDGGATWEPAELPTGIDAALLGVRSTGAGAGFAVGDLGTVIQLAAPGGSSAGLTLPSGGVDLSVSPGRMYVDGILVECERGIRISDQPDLPGQTLPTDTATYVAYLDVWERHLTAVERPELREVALGGPDTATRTQVVWQVRLEKTNLGSNATCASFGPGWAPDQGSPGRMRARAKPAPLAASDCMVPANGGYRRLENQLYRVEVHDGGAPGTATLVWSRDNGSMVSLLDNIDDSKQTVTVMTPGQDDVTGFASAALLELSDEGRTLRGEAGELVPVLKVGPEHNTIYWDPAQVTTPPAMSDFGAGATVRRWDGTQQLTADAWIDLEDGVQVEFTAGNYTPGEYWVIPARTLTADIEWPTEAGVDSFQPADGIRHHYAVLGLVAFDGSSWSVSSDCRNLFPPLTEMTRFFYVGGDGQEGDPTTGQPLAEPLEVGVMNGRRPVVGAPVSFTVQTGAGSVTTNSTTASSVIAHTDAQGIAACSWTLGGGGDSQRVQAQLLDASDNATDDTPIHFNATVEQPAQQGVCTVSVRPGDDLQAAAKQLSETGGEMCLAAGDYELGEQVVFEGNPVPITITGRGPATRIMSTTAQAIVITGFSDVLVRGIYAEARGELGALAANEYATLRFQNCEEVKVIDCVVRCADGSKDAKGPAGACIAVHGQGDKPAGQTGVVVLERNRLEVGAGQVGAYVSQAALARSTGNRVVITPGPQQGGFEISTAETAAALARSQAIVAAEQPSSAKPPTAAMIKQRMQQNIVDEMRAARTQQSASTEQVDVGDQAINVTSSAPTAPLWREFAASPEAAGGASLDTSLKNFAKRVTETVLSKGDAGLSQGLSDALGTFVGAMRASYAGLYVEHSRDVEITDNELEDTLLGILLNEVTTAIVSRNIVHSLLPSFVQGAAVRVRAVQQELASLSVVDTIAILTTPIRKSAGVQEKASFIGRESVAVDVQAEELGPYMLVRQVSADGFHTGVRVAVSGQFTDATDQRMWLIAEVMAANSGAGVPVDATPPNITTTNVFAN